MTIRFNRYWRIVDIRYKNSFQYCLHEKVGFGKNNNKLFDNTINNNNPFLKALNLKYEN